MRRLRVCDFDRKPNTSNFLFWLFVAGASYSIPNLTVDSTFKTKSIDIFLKSNSEALNDETNIFLNNIIIYYLF